MQYLHEAKISHLTTARIHRRAAEALDSHYVAMAESEPKILPFGLVLGHQVDF